MIRSTVKRRATIESSLMPDVDTKLKALVSNVERMKLK